MAPVTVLETVLRVQHWGYGIAGRRDRECFGRCIALYKLMKNSTLSYLYMLLHAITCPHSTPWLGGFEIIWIVGKFMQSLFYWQDFSGSRIQMPHNGLHGPPPPPPSPPLPMNHQHTPSKTRFMLKALCPLRGPQPHFQHKLSHFIGFGCILSRSCRSQVTGCNVIPVVYVTLLSIYFNTSI